MSAREPEPSTPFVQVRELRVAYGARPALAIDALDLPRRGISAIVGPSGCGKSTFLQTLNRLTDLVDGCGVRGRVRVDGTDVHAPGTDVVGLRRRVGMVFQKPNPFPISIRRNLALPLREHGVPRREIPARVESALREVGLWDEVHDRLDRPATTLSGGQQQRLCLARALGLRPAALLFDEPCGALDPLASARIEELIASLGRRVPVVIVTHDLAQARRLAHQLAVFWVRDGVGTVLESGPAARLLDAPREPLVADYLAGVRG